MRLEMEIDKVEELCCDKAGRLLGASCKTKKNLGMNLQEYCLTGRVSGPEMTLHNSWCAMHCLRRTCCSYTGQHAIRRPVFGHDVGEKRVAKALGNTKSSCTDLNCEGEADAREASAESPGRDRLWVCWECSE